MACFYFFLNYADPEISWFHLILDSSPPYFFFKIIIIFIPAGFAFLSLYFLVLLNLSSQFTGSHLLPSSSQMILVQRDGKGDL